MARQSAFSHFASRPEDEYTRRNLNTWTISDLKAEYKRLREPIQARLKRFEGTEWTNSEQYKRNAGQYPTINKVTSKEQAINLILKSKGFLNAQRSTISGLERDKSKKIKTLNNRGYDFINKENFNDFVDFMNEWKARMAGLQYDSEQVAELYDMTQELGVDPKELFKSFSEYKHIKKNKAILGEYRRAKMADPNSDSWNSIEIKRQLKNARERVRYHESHPNAKRYKGY